MINLPKRKGLIMDTKKSIQQLVKEALDGLKAQGYSPAMVRQYGATYKNLLAYLSNNEISEYSETVGLEYLYLRFGFKLEGFFGTLPGTPRNITTELHHLMVLWHYQQYGTIEFITRARKTPFVCPGCFQKEYDAFLVYTKNKYTLLGLVAVLKPVQRFLVFLNGSRVLHIDDINPSHLSTFISMYIGNSPGHVAAILRALRTFFKYLHNEGHLGQELGSLLPKVKYIRNAFIPPLWKKEHVLKLLKAVDRGNPIGKRDYAILLLVVRLGLRVSDIRNLRLSSLDWNRKKITLTQRKNKKTLELPMLDDIAWALIDYLKNGRPKTKSSTVFVHHRAPYGAFKDGNNMYQMLRAHMKFAGLEIPKNERCGLHSLRSTLARTMLENGTPLPVISEVLGHESVQSASAYLRINIDALQKCALDPEEVFLCET